MERLKGNHVLAISLAGGDGGLYLKGGDDSMFIVRVQMAWLCCVGYVIKMCSALDYFTIALV